MNTWQLSWNGLRTVTGLELRLRIRSKRWIWALASWFVLVGAVTWLVIAAIQSFFSYSQEETAHRAGPLAFGLIVFFILGLGLMIAPAFTATSLNGDRAAGTLATLQATRLSALEIAAGKLVAAWCTAAVFLVVATPFIAVSMVLGSISLWQVLVTFAVMFAEVAVVCAIGLGWSALMSRTAISTLLTYLSVVTLSVISTLVMLLGVATTVEQNAPIRVWGLPPDVQASYDAATTTYWDQHPDGDSPPTPPVSKCAWYDSTQSAVHYDRVWWITVVNPFVIVADAAPLPEGASKNLADYSSLSTDPLAAIRYAVREASLPTPTERDDCIQLYRDLPGYQVTYGPGGLPKVTTSSGTPVNVNSPVKQQVVNVETPIWPWGLGANLLLGAGFFCIAVRRLAVPYGKLPRGTRVA